MPKTLKGIAAATLVALGFAVAHQTHAAIPPVYTAIDLIAPGTEFSSGRTLGFKFSLISNALVTSLGVFDTLGNGLSGEARVAIWDTAGNELVSATIPSGTAGALDGFFRYTNISSFSLLAGTQYIIGAQSPDRISSLLLGQGGDGSVDPNLNLIEARNSASTGFSFPSVVSAGVPAHGAWLGPNLRLTAPIPEPETYQMLALGLLAVTAVAGRRRKHG